MANILLVQLQHPPLFFQVLTLSFQFLTLYMHNSMLHGIWTIASIHSIHIVSI